ncbi:MAG TPA: serine/threonine-protein kinase [Myxococcota bacterium]|nr:serine/threonine-protein kinase [Myxococcota bacterium]
MPVRTPEETAAGSSTLLGARVGDRYELVRLIGVGAVGQVFEARQVALARRVAVKLVPLPAGEGASGPQARRFAIEGETLARLAHPHVVSVFDVGVWRGQGFLVMELLPGRTLGDLMEEAGRVPLTRLIRVARQVCAALDATHRAGVIHRDLKPTNILLATVGGDDTFVKVIDFGIAKDLNSEAQLTVQGTPLGTPRYMAPEQVTGAAGAIGPAADIYSLGAILFRGAMGRTMFPDAHGMFQLIAHLREPPPRFDDVCPGHGLPPAFEEIVRRCLEKRLEDRYASAAELDLALARIEAELLLETSASGRRDRPADVPVPGANVPRAEDLAARPRVSLPPWAIAALVGGVALTAAVLGGTLAHLARGPIATLGP